MCRLSRMAQSLLNPIKYLISNATTLSKYLLTLPLLPFKRFQMLSRGKWKVNA